MGALKWITDNLSIFLPIAVTLCASLATAFTKYPTATGVLAKVQKVLDFLSFLTHKDSPGMLQAPVLQMSKPPAATPPTN